MNWWFDRLQVEGQLCASRESVIPWPMTQHKPQRPQASLLGEVTLKTTTAEGPSEGGELGSTYPRRDAASSQGSKFYPCLPHRGCVIYL